MCCQPGVFGMRRPEGKTKSGAVSNASSHICGDREMERKGEERLTASGANG